MKYLKKSKRRTFKTKTLSYIKKKRTIKRKHKRRHSNTLKKYRKNKKGGSYIYYMSDSDKSGETKETTSAGKPFFRKIFDIPPEEAINEFQIITILQSSPPHPNIVTYYDVNPGESIDMEELITYTTDEDYAYKYLENKKELAKQIKSMEKVKDYLQGLGIMYLDWKFDNIGKSPEKDGEYKLFDFDHSGWIDTDTNEWLIKPEFLNSFTGPEKKLSPKELDDWAFNRYIIQEATRM